jgi:HD-GYP domain-containing protein (c-di-GMP phosphodiesterase class II)
VMRKEQEIRGKGTLTIGELFELANLIVDATERSEQLNSYAIYYFDTADITRSHVINVAIFATVLARGLGYSGDELIWICATALLHDVGIGKLDPQIFMKSTAHLRPDERNAINNHSGFGYELILQSDHKLEAIAEAVYQHHEKGDGSGYPRQIHENEMLPSAKILSLIDTYESFLHPREHRDALIPPQGIQELIKQEGNRFSRPVLKTLLETISLYPVGCYVELNSGELAKVIKTNPRLPVRPVIRILTKQGKFTDQPQVFDLAENSLITITKCVPPPSMTRSDS